MKCLELVVTSRMSAVQKPVFKLLGAIFTCCTDGVKFGVVPKFTHWCRGEGIGPKTEILKYFGI